MFFLRGIVLFITCSLYLVTLCTCSPTVRKYSSKENWYTGTMTPYEIMTDLKVDKSQIEYTGYEPIKIWVVSRHSSRYPEKKVLQAMFNVLPKIQAEVVAMGPENPCYSEQLKSWDPCRNLELDGEKLTGENGSCTVQPKNSSASATEFKIEFPSHVKYLTMQGRSTMVAMGQRFRERFGELIPPKLDSDTEFVFTDTQRTKESAFSFATGLFGETPPADCPRMRRVEKDSKVLKFDSACAFWKWMIKRDAKMSKIFDDFDNGEEMTTTLTEVKERCALKVLNRKTLMFIYLTCSFEMGWYDESPWCKFLLENHFQVLEYVEDLKLYNHCAYGHEMNYKIARPLFDDLLNFFTKPNEISFRFSFSHAKSLIKFSAFLGLFNETGETLRADNYKIKSEREWASSRFAGFSFNFTFILYESRDTKKRAVLLMLNEQRIKIPRCKLEDPNAYLCPLEKFKTIFPECDWEEFCKNEEYRPRYEEYYLRNGE